MTDMTGAGLDLRPHLRGTALTRRLPPDLGPRLVALLLAVLVTTTIGRLLGMSPLVLD